MINPVPVKRERLTDQVVNGLRQWLSSKAFSPGDRLPTEAQLMERFEVGRSTIREAVRVLGHAGILQVRAGDGTYFTGFTHETGPLISIMNEAQIAEVFEVRRAFEMAIARLAAEKRTAADLVKIRRALEAGKKAANDNDKAGFLRADYQFHVALTAAARNTLLLKLYKALRGILTKEMANHVERKTLRERLLVMHERLFQAIKQRSASDAQAVWSDSANPFL
jgi:GntR family transcriptional regulator, transcriptional repressor for pyruvate dehydrogenase complex